eukprot:CAMPEP_0183360720 /NCGR_PEP_ID=MMETSP0164_2-20130417/55981_1 /TAXON_ID=221442 /ORGANISM="Coccolithus pelagicus ssp braarudi, Strain PLY182g" /LENGTH=58 /DNA_ID=CAMNT_0025535143 /DNA_START=48 /DNA_END=224 /DNA_ORIENTATION=+
MIGHFPNKPTHGKDLAHTARGQAVATLSVPKPISPLASHPYDDKPLAGADWDVTPKAE